MNLKKGKRLIQISCILAVFSFFSVLVCSPGIAAIYTQQELSSTDWRALETFIWQDFEYWHAPANYGWQSSCPPYPNFGF
ncbi:MAG: hypothetical protein ACMUIU_02860 [bacterium]